MSILPLNTLCMYDSLINILLENIKNEGERWRLIIYTIVRKYKE